MTRRIGLFASLVLLAVGPLLGIVTYRLASRYETERVAVHFEEYFSDRSSMVTQEILTLSEVLQTTKSLFESGGSVTREEFRAFTRSALSRHPDIQALEWIPRVPGESRLSHEQQGRVEGLQGYRITDHLPDGGTVPSPERGEYYPVFYVEPMQANGPALGFDLGSEKTRRTAIIQAMESGELTLTDPVDLVQETGPAKGFLAVLPVYTAPSNAVPIRSDGLRGFVLLAFRITAILDRSIPRLEHERPARMHFQLVDDDVDGKPMLVYSSAGYGEDRASEQEVRERRITLGGQQWRLIGHPTKMYLSEYHTVQPLWFGVIALLAWEALSVLLISVDKRLRDSAVKEHDRLLRSVCFSMNDGIVVADKNGKFLVFNKAAEEMVGAGAIDVSQADWTTTYGCYLPDGETPYPADQLPLSRAIRGERVTEAEIFIRNPKKPNGAWLSISGAPLTDDKGDVSGGAIVIRDVTERKASEAALYRLSNAVEQTDDTVFITNRRGTIEYVNPAFEATTGYTRKEAIGNTPRILKSGTHDEKYYKTLWSTILAGSVHRGTAVNRKKNGELYYAEQTITPMKDSTGRITHFVSVVKDITERRKKEQLELEMELAAVVQRKLYPHLSPKIPGLDIAGEVFPAAVVCGDYFDYITMPNEGFGIAIGDVTGHGVGPALVMASTRAHLRSLAHDRSDLSEVLTTVSRTLADDLDVGNFVTLLLARIDIRARRLTYVNAGHTSGYVLDRLGALKAELVSTGMPLGISPEVGHRTAPPISLDTGDLIVLITDGITESQTSDGDCLDPDGTLEVIKAHCHKPVREIVDHIHNAAREFACGGAQEDDAAIVVCRVEGEV